MANPVDWRVEIKTGVETLVKRKIISAMALFHFHFKKRRDSLKKRD